MPGTSSWRTDTRMRGLTAERAARRADVGESSRLLELVLFVTLDMVDDGDETETEPVLHTATSTLILSFAHSKVLHTATSTRILSFACSYRRSNGGISSDEGN
jgi:hypothetical protein